MIRDTRLIYRVDANARLGRLGANLRQLAVEVGVEAHGLRDVMPARLILRPHFNPDLLTQHKDPAVGRLEVLDAVLDQLELLVQKRGVYPCRNRRPRSARLAYFAESERNQDLRGPESSELLSRMMQQLRLFGMKVHIQVGELGIAGNEPDMVRGNHELAIHQRRAIHLPPVVEHLRPHDVPADARFRRFPRQSGRRLDSAEFRRRPAQGCIMKKAGCLLESNS
jgi:hypothetical protein